VRRVFLLTALLLLLGLSTAFAASFSTEAEDIASFTTEVSISVPDTPVPLPGTIYVGGGTGFAEGPLFLEQPPSFHTQNRLVLLDVEDVQAQTDPAAFFTWKTNEPPTTPPAGYLLDGIVTLIITQDELMTDRMTAGLFECEESATIDSSTPPSDPPLLAAGECVLIVDAVASTTPISGNGAGAGYKDRKVEFGDVGPVVIEPGHDLRLKIVNKSHDGVATVSTKNWNLSWGFNDARESFLTIVP
jgi:hypothetical protein